MYTMAPNVARRSHQVGVHSVSHTLEVAQMYTMTPMLQDVLARYEVGSSPCTVESCMLKVPQMYTKASNVARRSRQVGVRVGSCMLDVPCTQ